MSPSHNENESVRENAAPPVSVVVPVYNHEGYIEECVRSVLDQEYPHLELIIINDGSTDRTDQKLRSMLEGSHAQFRYILKDNEGLIKTLNRGLRLAQGHYFCELASDDLLLPGSISKRVAHLEEKPDIDVVFADALLLNERGGSSGRLMESREGFRSSRHAVQDMVEGKATIFFPSGMFRTSFLQRLGGFDEQFRDYEDLAMKFQLALCANVDYLDEPVMYHRRHGSNTSSTHKLSLRQEKILALEKLLCLSRNDKRTVKRVLSKEYVKLIRLLLTRRPSSRIATRDTIIKAFKIYPFNVKLWYYFVRYLARI